MLHIDKHIIIPVRILNYNAYIYECMKLVYETQRILIFLFELRSGGSGCIHSLMGLHTLPYGFVYTHLWVCIHSLMDLHTLMDDLQKEIKRIAPIVLFAKGRKGAQIYRLYIPIYIHCTCIKI